jgi:hypothetical protein
MVRVEKVPDRTPKRVTIKLSDVLSVDVERDRNSYKFYHRGSEVGSVVGSFIEACIYVDNYLICFSKEELKHKLKEVVSHA